MNWGESNPFEVVETPVIRDTIGVTTEDYDILRFRYRGTDGARSRVRDMQIMLELAVVQKAGVPVLNQASAVAMKFVCGGTPHRYHRPAAPPDDKSADYLEKVFGVRPSSVARRNEMWFEEI